MREVKIKSKKENRTTATRSACNRLTKCANRTSRTRKFEILPGITFVGGLKNYFSKIECSKAIFVCLWGNFGQLAKKGRRIIGGAKGIEIAGGFRGNRSHEASCKHRSSGEILRFLEYISIFSQGEGDVHCDSLLKVRQLSYLSFYCLVCSKLIWMRVQVPFNDSLRSVGKLPKKNGWRAQKKIQRSIDLQCTLLSYS